MKKQIFRFLSGFIPAMALFTQLNAQHERPGPDFNGIELTQTDQTFSTPADYKNNAVSVNARALRDFRKCFKNAGNTDWFEMQDGYLVKFTNNGTPTRVFYDSKGRWSATICTYAQDKLPLDIVRRVRSTYYDYSIYLANEIRVGDVVVYLVSIKDQDGYKTIRVTTEEMDIYEEFQKI